MLQSEISDFLTYFFQVGKIHIMIPSSRLLIRQIYKQTVSVNSSYSVQTVKLPKQHEWNRAVASAEKMVGFPTSIFNMQSLMNDDVTGKSLSEALIFSSTTPQYVIRLFIELRVHYMKIATLDMLCTQIVFDIQNNLCTQHVLSLQFSCNELVIQLIICCHIVG